MAQDDLNKVCQNCEQPFDHENQKYCSQCGQLRQDRLTVFSLLKNAISSYFALDSKLTRTLIPFLNQPGELAKQYIAGKRKRFLSPFQMYVFFSFLLFFVGSNLYFKNWDKSLNEQLSKVNLIDELKSNEPTENSPANFQFEEGDSLLLAVDGVALDSLISVGASNEEIVQFFNGKELSEGFPKRAAFALVNFYRMKGKGTILIVLSQLSLVLIFSLLINSFFLYLLYLREHFSFAEQLVFSTYNYAFAFFIVTVFFIINKLLPEFQFWLITAIVLLMATFYVSMKNVFGQSWQKTGLKFSLFLLFTVLIVLPFSIILLGSLSLGQLGQ